MLARRFALSTLLLGPLLISSPAVHAVQRHPVNITCDGGSSFGPVTVLVHGVIRPRHAFVLRAAALPVSRLGGEAPLMRAILSVPSANPLSCSTITPAGVEVFLEEHGVHKATLIVYTDAPVALRVRSDDGTELAYQELDPTSGRGTTLSW